MEELVASGDSCTGVTVFYYNVYQVSHILIDDPVQQMDEINACAFLDLIRGLSSQQQFIIFSCSRDFYLLALEKLDCLNKAKRGSFLAYRLEGIAPAELKVHCDAP